MTEQPTPTRSSTAGSSRSLWWFFLVLVAAAFALNWLWEMVQMPAYAEMAGRPWPDTLRLCTVATLGDVVFTLAAVGVGTLASGQPRWAAAGRWNVYATASLLGAAFAVIIEWKALTDGRWSYSERMPIVPVLKVGLYPLLQLSVLTPASVWLAARVNTWR